MASVITRFVAKQLFGQKGAIANRKAVDFSAAKMAERLSEFGIDPRQIKTEKELIQLLNLVKQAEDQAFAQKFSGILAPKKSAEVVDLQGKKIPNPEKNIMGGQAFETEEEIAERIAKQNKESIERLKEKRLKEKLDDADDLDPEEKADGGRIGYFLGSPGNIKKGQSLLRALLNYFGKETGKAKPSDFLRLTNPKSFNKLFEEAQGKMSKEGIMGTDMVKDYQTQMLGERIKSIKDMLESGKNIKRSQDRITSYKNEVKQKFMDDLGLSEEEAEVAATRLSTLAENIVSKEGSRKLPNITEEGILQLENIIKNMETGGKKARELNAYGGRIGYKLGGIDKGRRAFLAALGAGAAGIGAAKTGILKFLSKGKKASKALEVTTPNAPGKPEWFDALVNKVIKEGNDVSKNFATKEREIVHVKALDDETTIYVHRDLDTGTVRVDIDDPFRNVQGEQGDALVSLEVKPGIADETTRGKPADEFTAVENDYANYMDGPDDYVTEVIDNTVTNTKNLTSDLTKVKLYAKDQKKPTIKELMESRKRKKMLDQAENEPSQYAADRQPDYNPDPEEYMDDNFASGGIARMLGE